MRPNPHISGPYGGKDQTGVVTHLLRNLHRAFNAGSGGRVTNVGVDLDQEVAPHRHPLWRDAVRHSTARNTLRVGVHTDQHAVSIAIENTGDGMAQEHLERVFDRFFRVYPSRQRSTEGTGLCLAIAKSIVVAHGGTIAVTSLDKVTTFPIRLPRVP